MKRLTFLFLIFFLLAGFPVKSFSQPLTLDSAAIRVTIKEKYGYAFNDPDSGLIIANHLMAAADKIEYPYGVAYAKIFLADCYISKGDYARAIRSLLEARTLCLEENISELNQRVNRPFGRLYIELGTPERAVTHQLLALKQSTEEEETLIVTHGLAEAYYASGNLDSALFYAAPLFERVGKYWAAPVITLGNIYTSMGNLEKAQATFSQSSQLTFDIDVVGNYTGRARAFLLAGQIDSCRFYAAEALALAREKKFYKFVNEASTILASTYENEDREQFLDYLLISYSAKDSLYSKEKLNQINNFIFADESRKRDLAITEVRFANQKRIFLLVALSVFLLTGGLLLWRINRTKTKSNVLLLQEKNKVEAALEKLKRTQSKLIEAEKTARRLEEKEVGRLRDLDRSKTRLYTNITHEFRTPLTVIMGLNDSIQGFDRERKLIRRNSRNLLRLINQMLDLSKLDAGNMKMDLEQGDIISYLQYLTESFHSMAAEKKIALAFTPKVASLSMDFDAAKIQHVMYNLLSNAIKFTPAKGKVFVNVTQQKKENSSFLQVTVEDTGVGISAQDIPHIFDRFFQAEHNNAMRGEGTGIGLALTKELVELMGGSISVTTEEGQGTSFYLLLPVVAKSTKIVSKHFTSAHHSELQPLLVLEKENSENGQPGEEKSKVLLIEDNEGVVAYIRMLLKKEYNLEVAEDGQSGIEKALEQVPDLIITDVMMPKKDGFEVCQTLKDDERTSHIPIIMLTAKADISSKIEGLKTGVDAYLTKPFEKQELFIRIRKLMELRDKLKNY